MLKRIVLGVAIVLLIVVIGGGIEAYRIYNEAIQPFTYKITNFKHCEHNLLTVTPRNHGAGRQAGSTSGVTPTPLPVGGSTPPNSGVTPTPSTRTSKQAPCDPVNGPLPTLSGKKRIDILLLGSDNDKKGIPLLSQTMMVITIDPVHKKVALLSIPRDFWLYIPGVSYPGDPSTYQKIDAALSYGEAGSTSKNPQTRFLRGVALAEATVEYNFHIPIHYFAWVGLTGFIKVINTLHGVVIDAEHPIVDDNYPADLSGGNPFAWTRVYIPPGPQYMDGSTALEYVRSRHADLVGDFGRGARQEQMLLGIRRKANGLGLTNIQTIMGLIGDLQGYVKTNVGSGQIIPMTTFARSLNPSKIKRLVLSPPKYSAIGSFGDASIVNPNWAAINPVVKKMFAPPSSIGKKKKPKHRAPKLTQALALKELTRVSGATPPTTPKPTPTSPPTSSLKGRIFFEQNGNIWSFDRNGISQITHTTSIRDASVSANGKAFAWSRRWSPLVSDIFLRKRGTTKPVRITQDAASDGTVQDNVWAYDTAISPNGKTIIYASDAYKLVNDPTGGIDLALYRYDVATGTSTQITTPVLGAGGDADPRFDPSNPNQILFTRYYYLPNDAVASRLMLLHLNSDRITPLTPYRARISQGAWQPHGRHIAFVEASGQGSSIYDAYFANGKLHMKHTQKISGGMVSEPTFSPHGEHMAFYKLVGNDFQLYADDFKNGMPTRKPYKLLAESGLDTTSALYWVR